MKNSNSIKLSLGILTLLLLNACASTMPYSAEEQSTDQSIRERVLENFKQEKYTFLDHVDVTVYKSTVILGGLVFEAADRDLAVQDARKVTGVKQVSDQIEVESNAY
ncbi:MAG: BON domain-containing protein [Betaproteobacteria bacterium]|nr:BON domain-containing protein [Betaproteobacteria bacterium]MDE2423983.1 BON domain-containing protein [Betaproteobacteria bacterium]